MAEMSMVRDFTKDRADFARCSSKAKSRSLGAARWSSLLNGARLVAGLAIALGLTSFLDAPLHASEPIIPGKLIVRRSTRAIPHKFLIQPTDVILAANQTQRFEVTDTEGNPVAVHWNVSGIGCSGEACGTVDGQGNYHPPATLPQPRIVTLEGVLASDANYSVLTEVRLAEANTDAPAPAASDVDLSAATMPSSAPAAAIAAAPAPPMPSPTLQDQSLASRAASLPLPRVVGAAPALPMSERTGVSKVSTQPLPNVVAAAPALDEHHVRDRAENLPLPTVVAAAPEIAERRAIASPTLPLPQVIAAAPPTRAALIASPPPEVRATPTPQTRTAATKSAGRSASISLPIEIASSEVALGPAIQRQPVAFTAPQPLPHVVVGASGTPVQNAPNSLAIMTPAPAPRLIASASAATPSRPASSLLLPMQDAASSSALFASTASSERGPVVTYQDGKLSIAAENATLASVLKLVGEKIGASINVPPGTGQERIFEHAGPASANEVLTQLLNGSSFDFIIVNSAQAPHEPAEVLLTMRDNSAPTGMAPLNAPPAMAAMVAPPPPESNTPVYMGDPRSLLPPPPDAASVNPQDLGKMMKDMAQQLREKIQAATPQ